MLHLGFSAKIVHASRLSVKPCPPPVSAAQRCRSHGPTRQVARAAGSVDYEPVGVTIDDHGRLKSDQLKQRFKAADTNGDGQIDLPELKALLEACGDQTLSKEHWMRDDEVAGVMAQYDKDKTGSLSQNEFNELVADGVLLDDKVAEYVRTFEAMDTEKTGTITAQHLREMLSGLGWDMPHEGVVQLMHSYDKNEDGRLQFGEFLALMHDHMLDLQEVLEYIGARAQTPSTNNSVAHSVAHDFQLIMSQEDLEQQLKRHSGDLVVLMAGATWCSGCKAMVEPVRDMASHYKRAMFVVLFNNVNASTKYLFKDVLKARSTPSFFLFRDGKCVMSFAGGNVGRLEAEVRRHLHKGERPEGALWPAALSAYA